MKKTLLLVLGLALGVNAFATTASYNVVLPSLPFADPGYTANGSITAIIAETGDCQGGTYTVNAVPVLSSGPGGSTPPNTSTTSYIGFPASQNFLFSSAGYGQYTITTTTTACASGTAPAPIVDVITVAAAAASAPRPIPTLSMWGVITLTGLMLFFGLRGHRRLSGHSA